MRIINSMLAYSPNLKQSWRLIIIFLLCQVVGSAANMIIKIAGVTTPEWETLSGNVLGYIVLALIIFRFGKGDNDASVRISGLSPLLWFLLVPFTWSFGLAAESLTMWIPTPDIIKQMFADMIKNNLPSFLLLVVMAPVCEEWLCRGIILKGLLARYSPLKAIVWSAVMFGVVHMNPRQGVFAFFLGLALGWIYWRTRSLRYCIFMHAVNNAAAFLSALFFSDTQADITIADIAGGYYIYAVVLVVCALSWIAINKIISSGAAADARDTGAKCHGTK